MSVKDRVSTAAEATAASVSEIRPLTLPESSAVPAERRGHPGRNVPRVGETLVRIKETWAIPLAAAVVVVALALSLVILRHAEAPTQTGPVAPAAVGVPQYYAMATEEPASHARLAAINVTVVDVRTGKTLTTVKLPTPDLAAGINAAVGVSAAADDRTFVVGSMNEYTAVTYFLVHIAPGAKQVATFEQLPIPLVNLGVLLGLAVSPDGKDLAVLSMRGNGTTLRIYSVKSGATLRTWTAGTWENPYIQNPVGTTVSWTADNRQVAFSRVVYTSRKSSAGALEERLIGVTAPSGDLATASKVDLQGTGQLLVAPAHPGRRDRRLRHGLPPARHLAGRLRKERADVRRLLRRHRQAPARPVPVPGALSVGLEYRAVVGRLGPACDWRAPDNVPGPSASLHRRVRRGRRGEVHPVPIPAARPVVQRARLLVRR